MITVYKYCIEDYKKNVCRVILPIGAQILKIYSNGNKRIDMWAKVDTTVAEEVCYFYVIKTGENITKKLEQRDKSKNLDYIDSFYDKDNIHWHVFKAAAASTYSSGNVIGSYRSNYRGPVTTTPYYTLCSDGVTTATTAINCKDSASLTSISSEDRPLSVDNGEEAGE